MMIIISRIHWGGYTAQDLNLKLHQDDLRYYFDDASKLYVLKQNKNRQSKAYKKKQQQQQTKKQMRTTTTNIHFLFTIIIILDFPLLNGLGLSYISSSQHRHQCRCHYQTRVSLRIERKREKTN